MKSILFIAACIVAAGFALTSCRFASSPNLGDTVAASVFEPADTALINKKARAKAADTTFVADSVGLYYIGSGSTREFIQLVSYPSRRDTTVYGKTRHIRVEIVDEDDVAVDMQAFAKEKSRRRFNASTCFGTHSGI